MSVLDQINELMSEGASAKADVSRMSRLKKMLNLRECDSIKKVSDTKLKKFVECYGKTASEGLKRYSDLTEDTSEKARIKKVLATLGL